MRDRPIGPAYHPDNVFAVKHLPLEFERVLVLPILNEDGGMVRPEIQDAFIAALRSTGRFEIILSPELAQSEDSASFIAKGLPLPLRVLEVAKLYDADGIMQVDLTHFRPYKPLQIGVRSRLLSLNERGDILWSIDELFDAGRKDVAIGARKYAEANIEQPFPLQSSYSVLMSPVRFASYVGTTAFNTLPVREEDLFN